MATTVGQLLQQHPANPVDNPQIPSSTNKPWAAEFPPITNLAVHTYKQFNGAIGANFDLALHPEYDDDDVLRKSQPAYPPNERSWRLYSEEDANAWFHTEVSNIVLAGWARYTDILQASQAGPFGANRVSETVDVAYTATHENQKIPLAIGEMKRSLIDGARWQDSVLRGTQLRLSRELRGYAYKYECPHIFCFDGDTLILLQFRVDHSVEQIMDPNCPVDCWVIPRQNEGGCTLRYALYRFLAQGFRRFQSLWPIEMPVGGMRAQSRICFNGQPVWKVGNALQTEHPDGYTRAIDPDIGSFYWKLGENRLLRGNDRLWDTLPIWDVQQQRPL